MMEINWSLIMEDGLVITIVGYVIVFFALVILYFTFSALAKLVNKQARRRLIREGKAKQAEEKNLQIAGDVGAAIAMALYMHLELHDEESNILTIRRSPKVYSPWNSKIYSMRRNR
jgi:Na+-transporting methylmalonyl-CoA/oxaloacetate decarboxylase gamma subunit